MHPVAWKQRALLPPAFFPVQESGEGGVQDQVSMQGQGCARGQLPTSYPFREGPTRTTGRIEGTTSYGGVCSVCRERRRLQMVKRQRELKYIRHKLFFLNSVKGHGDLLLALYMVTWTVCPWWNLWKMINMSYWWTIPYLENVYTTVPSTSNRQNSSQSFMRAFQVIILSLAQIKFPFSFLIVNGILTFSCSQ